MGDKYFGYLMDANGRYNEKMELGGLKEAQEFVGTNLHSCSRIMVVDSQDYVAFDVHGSLIHYDGIDTGLSETDPIRVLIVKPDEQPWDTYVQNDLKSLQQIVGGYIEVLPLDQETLLICDEKGKLKSLPSNRTIGCDIIAGTFIVCGKGCEDFASLTNKQVSEWGEEFWDYDLETQTPIEQEMQ